MAVTRRKLNVKKGDTVEVISGKDVGKRKSTFNNA